MSQLSQNQGPVAGPIFLFCKVVRHQGMLKKWFTQPLGKKDSKLWRVVPVCLLWVIWKERNKIIFEDVAFSLDKVFLL